jgi:hypothetical protein
VERNIQYTFSGAVRQRVDINAGIRNAPANPAITRLSTGTPAQNSFFNESSETENIILKEIMKESKKSTTTCKNLRK